MKSKCSELFKQNRKSKSILFSSLMLLVLIVMMSFSVVAIAREFEGGYATTKDISSLGVADSALTIGSATSDSYLDIILETLNVPTLTTSPVNRVGDGEYVAKGTLVSENGSTVTQLGFVWNTVGAPTTSGSSTYITTGISLGDYFSELLGLTDNTLYFIRAFAENSEGVGYGNQIAFVTYPDIDSYTKKADIEFEPTQITGTPTYVIADQTVEGNDVIYALVDASGVTVWTSSISSSGGFYYGTDEDDQRFNPPSSARMVQSGEVDEDSPLPFYELFVEAGADSGISPALLYVIAHVAFAVFFGVLAYVFTGSVLVTIFVTIILHAGFMSTGILPMWFLIFFAFLALSILYLSRRV